MKTVNTPRGYDSAPLAGKIPWYYYPYFPVLPMLDCHGCDKYSTAGFSLSWLCFRIWSLDHFALEAAVEVESTGLNVRLIIGWLRVVIRILPMPGGWLDFLIRKPKDGGAHIR